MAQEPLLCTVCLGVTDVTTVCNSAPRLLLGHSHLLTEVQRSHQRTNLAMWCARFASPPPRVTLLLAHLISFVCAARESLVSTSQLSVGTCLGLFFFPLHHLFFSHTMFVPTFQSLPWQLVSAYWVTCLTLWVQPAVERSAERWRQVGEMRFTVLSSLVCFLLHQQNDSKQAVWSNLFNDKVFFF